MAIPPFWGREPASQVPYTPSTILGGVVDSPEFPNLAEYPELSRFRNPCAGTGPLYEDFGRRGVGFGELQYEANRAQLWGLTGRAYWFYGIGSRPPGFLEPPIPTIYRGFLEVP